MDFDKIRSIREAQKRKRQKAAELKRQQDNHQEQIKTTGDSSKKVTEAIESQTDTLLKNPSPVEVKNEDLAKSKDLDEVVESINKMNVTTFMSTKGFHDMAENIQNLSTQVMALQNRLKDQGLTEMSNVFQALLKRLETVAKTLDNTKVNVDASLGKSIDSLRDSIEGLDVNPVVNVEAPEPKVVTTPVELKPIVAALGKVEKAVKSTVIPDNSIDITPVVEGLKKVQSTISNLRFPVPNYILPFKDTDGKAIQVNLDSSGNVPVTIASGTNSQVSVIPQTSNGLSVFNATSSDGATALTNSAQAIKASAGQIYGWYIYNPNATAQFVQLYNVAAASVTVGTTNPLFMLTIPATSAANVEFTNGIAFSTAMSCAATSTASGSGAPSSPIDCVLFFK